MNFEFPRPNTPIVDGSRTPISFAWLQWLRDFARKFYEHSHSGGGGSGGSISHTSLTDLNSASYTHLTAANHTDLTDGGATTLHKHDHATLDNLNSASYTHLTAANHTDLTDGGATTLHKHDHSTQDNLNTSDYYHLTSANHTDLTDGGATTLHKHDHGGQDGLSDDDHSQYALLAGRAGGQTLNGGAAASQDLTLASTAHATKGKLKIGTSVYDEVNNWFGIGKTPTVALDIEGTVVAKNSVTTNSFLRVKRDDPNNFVCFEPQGGTGAVEYWVGATRSGSGIAAAGSFFVWDQTVGTKRLTIANDGVVNIPNLTPSKLVSTDANRNLVSSEGSGIDHTALANLNTTNYYHLTSANHTDLTDGGATTLHKHDHGGLDGLSDDDHTAYHTDSRALTWLGTRSTTDLPEGTNKYFTDARAISANGAVTYVPTGIVRRSTTTLSFNAGTRQLSIAPTGASFDIYVQGTKFTKSTTQTVTIADTAGTHYCYFNSSGVLSESAVAWDIEAANAAPVAIVYWRVGTSYPLVMDERHGVGMSPDVHHYLHDTVGTRYGSGLAGTFTASNTFSIGSGSVYDEDIEVTIGAKTTCRLLGRDGVTGYWSLTAPNTAYYKESAGGVLQYDNAGVWTDASASAYVAVWIFATNETTDPIWSVVGQREDTTLANAQANNTISGLALLNLLAPEMKLLYRVILRRNGTNEIVSDVADYRNSSNLPVGSYTATDHGSLSGLSNDTHLQYALLAGRSGGQTLYGGTAASENLTLGSTANATKGQLRFGTSIYDEVNNWLGVAKTPTVAFDVAGQAAISSSSWPPLKANRSTSNTTGVNTAVLVKHTTSGDMADTFAAGIDFAIEDDAAVNNNIARITAARAGADDTGDLTFDTGNAGSVTEKVRITHDGYLRVNNLTASQLVATDASKNLVSAAGATVPVGAIVFSNMALADISTYFDGTGLGIAGKNWANYAICNGNNGTPNLEAKFPRMRNGATGAGGTGGSDSSAHTHDIDHNHASATSASDGAHSHTISGATATEATHTHSVTSNVAIAAEATHTHSVTSNVAIAAEAAHTHTTDIDHNHASVTSGGSSAANTGSGSSHTHSTPAHQHQTDIGWDGGTLYMRDDGIYYYPYSGSTVETAAYRSYHTTLSNDTNAAVRLAKTRSDGGSTSGAESSHTHTITHTHAVDLPALGATSVTSSAGSSHTHTVTNNAVTSGAGASHTHSVTNNAVTSGAGASHSHDPGTLAAASGGAHTHAVDLPALGTTASGAASATDNKPAYYELIPVMRVA